MGKHKSKAIENLKSFELNPDNENTKFLMLFYQVLEHPNFKNLTNSSKVIYIYMKQWAMTHNKTYLNPSEYDNYSKTHPDKVAYSYSLAGNIVGDNKTFKSSINELMYYGFLMTPDEIIKKGFTDNYKTNKKGEIIKDKHGVPIEKNYKDYMNKDQNYNSNAKIYYFSDNWYKTEKIKLKKSEINNLNYDN